MVRKETNQPIHPKRERQGHLEQLQRLEETGHVHSCQGAMHYIMAHSTNLHFVEL